MVCDRHGHGRHLLCRDCSVQRRRQKIIEEAGVPGVDPSALTAMAERAASVLGDLGYDSVGTLETLWRPEAGFGFLEVNPRLQVEHGVTELVTGQDLVLLQISLAAGGRLSDLPPFPAAPDGHAVEARIYAEDPLRFLPSPGTLKVFRPPSGPGVRVETGFEEGSVVTSHYDPMIAQVMVHGADRPSALAKMAEALAAFEVEGVKTNLGFLRLMLAHPPFAEGRVHTGLAESLVKSPGYKEALAALEGPK